MEVIQSYFTDPELSNDTLRQVRSILCFIESRAQVPLNVVELEDLAELIRTIINNLELQYATEQAELQPCFDMFLTRYAHGIDLARTLTDEPVVFDENYKPEELIAPITEMLEMLLSKGVYTLGLEDTPYIVGIKEVFAQITNLFFNIFPKVLQKGQVLSKDLSLSVYKGVIDSMAIICSCCELFQPEVHQPTAYQLPDGVIMQRVNKDTILPLIPEAVLKNMSRLLRNLNIQTFEHLQHLKRQYTLDVPLVNDIQAAILYFLDNLLYQYDKVDLSIIIDQVGDFLACPISHGNLKLSLSILQTVKITSQSFDTRKLTRLLINQIFNTGGLYVDSVQTAEIHLALLNALQNLISQFPGIATFMCEDSDVLLKDDDPHLQNVNRHRKENMQTTQIVKNRIFDEHDREEQLRQSMRNQTVLEGELMQPVDVVEELEKPRTGTSDAEGLREVSRDPTATREAKSPIYSPQQEPRVRNANFVADYLIRMFQIYGTGGHHSSRELIKVLKQVSAQSGKLKKNVLEGHSINYLELNKTRIKLMNEKLVQFNQLKRAQAEEDERQLAKIRARGLSMKTTTQLYNYQQMQRQRDIKQQRQLQGVVQHSLKFSNAVEAWKDEDGSYQHQVGLQSRPRPVLVGTGTDYSGLRTYRTGELEALENRALHQVTLDGPGTLPGADIMTGSTASIGTLGASGVSRAALAIPGTSAAPAYDPERTAPHEHLFVLYGLRLLGALFRVRAPNRGLALALSREDEAFVGGLVSFAGIMPEATLDALLAAILAGRSAFLNQEVVEQLDLLIQGFQNYGAVFINNLFEAYGTKLPFFFVEKLAVQCSNGLVVLACQQPNQIVTEQCLGALAFLAHHYGDNKRTSVYELLLPYVQEILSEWLIQSLANSNSPSTLYVSVILIYCLFGVPRSQVSAQYCYESGVYKALIKYMTSRFSQPGEPPKITPSDVVVIRTFADLINDAPESIISYTKQQIPLQTAMCNIFKQFQRTLTHLCCDEHGVVYLGTEQRVATDVVPITDIYISEGGVVKKALSPIAQRIQGVTNAKRQVLSPARSRANLTQLESAVARRDFASMRLERFASTSKTTRTSRSIPQTQPNGGGPEAAYLLQLNVTSLILAFFRTLYPGLADPGSSLRPMRRDELDPRASGRPGRLPESRPATGATPQIGLKIPTLLPSLNTTNQEINKENNVISIGLSAENLLVLLQMIGLHVKAQLIQLSELDDDVLMKDDRVFIDQSKYKLNQRLMTLNLTGTEIADKIRKSAVVGEAKFYNWQGEDE